MLPIFNQAMKQGITTTYNLVQLSSPAFLCHLPLYGDHLLFNPILKERKVAYSTNQSAQTSRLVQRVIAMIKKMRQTVLSDKKFI